MHGFAPRSFISLSYPYWPSTARCRIPTQHNAANTTILENTEGAQIHLHSFKIAASRRYWLVGRQHHGVDDVDHAIVGHYIGFHNVGVIHHDAAHVLGNSEGAVALRLQRANMDRTLGQLV